MSSSACRPTVAVNGIIFQEPDCVLLTLRRDTNEWCVPGGLLECGESVIDAILREIREEIGVEAEVIKCTGIYSEPNIKVVSPATVPLIVLAFECRVLNGTPSCSDEVAEVKYFPIQSLPLKIVSRHQQRILDALQKRERPVIT